MTEKVFYVKDPVSNDIKSKSWSDEFEVWRMLTQHCPKEPSQLKQDISEIFNKSDENELKLENGAKKLIL